MDFTGEEIRLTEERLDHIESRPEMKGQPSKIEETLADPDEVRKSNQDESVHLYYRNYPDSPVSEKHLLVVAKIETEDPFAITAFFTDRIKSGTLIDTDGRDDTGS